METLNGDIFIYSRPQEVTPALRAQPLTEFLTSFQASPLFLVLIQRLFCLYNFVYIAPPNRDIIYIPLPPLSTITPQICHDKSDNAQERQWHA